MASNIVYVNPAAAANGNGSIAKPLNTWSQVTFQPGTTYLQMAGTSYQGNLTIGKSATGTSSIKIGAYGSGSAPVINGSVNFNGASNVSLNGFAINGGSGAGVLLQGGSQNIQIESNTISNSLIGVWLGNGTGGGNTISGNTIIGSTLYGIDVSGVINPAGQQTVISGNNVVQSGGSGLELEGSNFSVTNNTFYENGLTMAGSSGIHVYAPGAGSGFGDDNVLNGNTVEGTVIVGATDGNGIELDQWTSSNTVDGNSILGNDGSGIVLYDASNNTVSANMVFCNDAGPLPGFGAHAELVMVSSLGLTSGNTISDNQLLGIASDAPVVLVDGTTSALSNTFNGNMLEDFGAEAMYYWDGYLGGNANWWRSTTGGTDTLVGVLPAVGTGTGGIAYAFDADFTSSPFAATFRFPWQTGNVYGQT